MLGLVQVDLVVLFQHALEKLVKIIVVGRIHSVCAELGSRVVKPTAAALQKASLIFHTERIEVFSREARSHDVARIRFLYSVDGVHRGSVFATGRGHRRGISRARTTQFVKFSGR